MTPFTLHKVEQTVTTRHTSERPPVYNSPLDLRIPSLSPVMIYDCDFPTSAGLGAVGALHCGGLAEHISANQILGNRWASFTAARQSMSFCQGHLVNKERDNDRNETCFSVEKSYHIYK